MSATKIREGQIKNLNRILSEAGAEKFESIVDSAPAELDTLKEIAAAINNDPNFSKTVNEELSKKVDKVSGKGLSSYDFTYADEKKLSGIEDNANNYSHPDTHPASIITGLHACATTGNATTIDGHSYEEITSLTINRFNGEGIGSEIFNTINEKNNTATGEYSHAEGNKTTANGCAAHAQNAETTANGKYSTACGYGTTSETFNSFVIGCRNKIGEGTADKYVATSDAFVIGNGGSTLSNAFKVTFDGNVYCQGTFNSYGADYAEYFEWKDGNPDNEDRIGKFVTLDGDKIKIAESETDNILGIISGYSSIIGNSYEDNWHDMYLRDQFGRLQYESVEVEDKEGEKSTEYRIKINPEYDDNFKYVSRSKRKEWSTVGIVGQLLVIDDGTCEINGYCKCSTGGIATKAEERSLDTFKVMKRISENLILIFVK